MNYVLGKGISGGRPHGKMDRGTCPVCKGDKPVRADGKMAGHPLDPRLPRCDGYLQGMEPLRDDAPAGLDGEGYAI